MVESCWEEWCVQLGGSWQGLQCTPSTSVTGGRLVSSPADRMPWLRTQCWGGKHSVSTHCSVGRLCLVERGFGNLCVSPYRS